MNFIRNRMAILFFLALVITSGCRIIPWFGDYPSQEESFVGELLLSRNIDAGRAFNFNAASFKLSIPAGALEADAKIEITRFPMLLLPLKLPEEYKPVSELFSINLLPAVTTLSQPATIMFKLSDTSAVQPRFAACRNSDGEWKLVSPLPQESATEISFATLKFSDWVLVERVGDFTGALSHGMQITASPTAAVASITGFFEENLEISVCLKSNQPLNINPANNQLKIQLSTYDAFSLDVTTPDAPTGGRSFTSDIDNRVTVDLLSTSLAKAVASGNNATYTFLLKLKGKTPEELPAFLAMNAAYTTANGIEYSSVQTLTFSKAPPIDENAPVAPRISDTVPANGSGQIAGNTTITIVFDRKMDLVSVQNALRIADRAGNMISGSFSWQEDRVLTFTPAQTLLPATEYVISFIDGAIGQNGLALSVEGEYVFTTASNAAAELISYSPANNAAAVAFNTPIVLQFSQPIDPANLKFTVSPSIPGDYSTTWNDSKTEVSILYGSGYASNQVYQITVLETTLDSYGQAIKTSYSFSFNSETFIANRLIGISPASGSVGIAPDATFVFSFDNAMNIAATEGQISFSPPLDQPAVLTWADGATKLTVTAKLKTGTDYLVVIGKSVENQLLTSYAISYRVVSALQVTGTAPAGGTSGIAVGQPVEIRFNNPVNPLTLALTVNPAPPAGFTNTWSEGNTLLKLIPNADLLESQSYQVTVGKTTADTFGTSPGSDYTFNFTTGAVTPPTISSTQPVAGSYDVPVNQQIKILFSKAMDQGKTQAAITVNPATTPTITWENADTTMVIGLGDTLAYDTSYQITVGTGATDKSGLSLAQNYQLGFSTIARPAVLTSRCYPAAGTSGIPPQAVIKIEFSRAMNKDSAQSAFSLKQGSTAINGVFSWSGNIMSFTPVANLAYNQTYQISVAATALDSLGNSLAAAVSWSFTTAADEGKSWVRKQDETDDVDKTFSKRSEHVMIGFKNSLWVIGGFDGSSYLNDVWNSDDGVSWTRITNAASFGARSGHACAVYGDDIWLTGGYNSDTGLYDDVWKSRDGKNWDRVSSSAEYYARHGHTMAVFANKLWVIGGQGLSDSDTPILLDDCWSSSNGQSWTENSSIVSFFPRKLHTSGVVNGRLWVWGGYGEDAYSSEQALRDAWSTADGEFWRLESSATAFPARCAAASAFFNNRIWMMGGASNDPYTAGTTYYNDIWVSSDGTNWVQILGNSAGSETQFSPRVLHGAATTDDMLFVSGGELASYFLSNEVWSTE